MLMGDWCVPFSHEAVVGASVPQWDDPCSPSYCQASVAPCAGGPASVANTPSADAVPTTVIESSPIPSRDSPNLLMRKRNSRKNIVAAL